MANLKNKLNQLADKTKQAAEQKAKTTTTTTKKSSGAGAAVSNITQAAQAAVQNKQQGSQGVTQASINRMEKAAQQNPNQTIADRQKAIRSGQKVTASPTQTAKPTITAGRESTTPLAKAAGSSNIKNKLVQTQIKTDQRRKANLSRLGKDSTIGRDFGYTRDRDLTAVTITPAQQLNSLATRINDNEQQLINWGRRLSVLKAKANRGDEGAVASYNLLADKYNAAFEDYVSDIDAYNKLYNGAYRDSAVRGKYAQREYMQQRQANRDLGARRSYQQRLNEEEARAPQETTLRRKGASVGEHSYKRISGEEPREAGYTFTHEPTRLQQWGRAIHNSYVGNMKAAAGAFYRNSIPEGGSVSGMNSEIGVSDQSKARLQYWSNELLSSGREQSNLGTYQTSLASQGLGAFGTFIVDASIAGVQMLMDMGISVVTGGSMLPAMFVRSMGGGYLTAEQMGASDEEALAYGIGVGAVEALSEKMFSVFSIGNRFAKGAVNKEMSERIIDRVVKHMATTPEGKTALSRLFTLLFATGSEGLEEVAAGIMEPVIRKFTMDPELDISSEIDWQEALYEGLIGGLLGGIGGAVDLPNTRGTYWKYYNEGLDEGIQRYEEAVKKHGLESKEAMKAAKEIWTAGNENLNAVVGTRDGRPVTIHQLAAAEAATRYGRTDAEGNQVQGPRLADSLNLNNYLEQEENARKEAENQRLEAARREEAARLEAEEKARVDAEKTAQSARDVGTLAQGGETVRLDTARSAQARAQASRDVDAYGVKSGEFEAQPQTARGGVDLSSIPEDQLTQEEKDELAYGSGAVEDLGQYTGLAQRLGAPARAVADNENAADEGGGEASFSIVRTRTMPWRQQVKGYFKKDGSIRSSDSLYLGESEAFIDGVPQAPLYIPTSVITKATRKTKDKSSKKGHELTERDIESLRDGIDNAVAVIANPSRNALVYITGNIDREGNPIIIAFDLNHDLFGENAHRATSIHGRVSIGGLLDNLGSDATVYVRNENRLDQMLSGRGIHTSQLLAQVKSIDGSIPQNTNNSKEENDNGAVYDGSSQRDAGERGRGGSGSLGETAGGSEAGQVPAQRGSDGSPAQTDRGIQQVRKNESHKAKAEKRRQNGAALEKTSGSSEGIDKTDDRASMQILTDDMVEADAELTEIRTRLEDLGFDVRFFLGSIGLRTGGKARGAQQGNTVWICVDDSKWTATQISKHEELHGEARRDPKLIGRLIGRLRAEETDKLNKITRRYQEALLLRSQGAEERALRVLEEMLCDLYAGINEFTQKNAEARSLHDLIKDEIKSQQAEGVRETRGPPDDGEVSFSLVDTKVPTREEMDADYMAAVENGDMETARRMVEEAAKAAGYDLHLYHGSRKGGGFTVFRDWQYFTGSRKYAERYQERDNPGSLYEVFARSDRMFDTRNAEAADLFEQHRGEYGMGELQDSGLPDWTDGYDISEMIEENELDYDGVILDEGGDLVDGEPVSRGPSYVLRKSNQIKSAEPVTYDDDGEIIPLSQRFNQDESDIRFSEIEEGEEDSEEMTAAELMAARKKAEGAKRYLQKTQRRMNLTQQESELVNALIRGTLTEDQLPPGIDRQGVLAVCRAKQTYLDAMAPVDEYNRQRRERNFTLAEQLIENSDEWKDMKNGFAYARETARRIFYGLTKNTEEAQALIDTYVETIRKNEAAKNRMINEYNERIKKLGIDTKTKAGNKVSEAYAVQFVGEAEFMLGWLEQLPEGTTRDGLTYGEVKMLLDEFWRDNPNLDQDRVHAAVAEFRGIYDELFAMVNEARVLNGYAPIDYRKGYFPHFTSDQGDNIIQSLARGMGIGVEVTELPTSIAGTTHLFRPGIQWSGHMLQRTGNDTDYNALEGWDRYIPAVANIIYHTEDIQKLRALETVIRRKYSDTTVQDEIDATRRSKDMTAEEINAKLDELFKRDATQLNYFVQWLREYTNQLAGKKAELDRNVEKFVGRKVYRIVQKLENRVAANMLGGNISSAMTNFVPLFQAWGNVSTASMMRAMWDTGVGAIRGNGWRDGSSFLVNRKGYDAMYQTLFGKVKNALFAPFNWVDDFVSETVVRARYYDELRRGLSPEAAMVEADAFAGGVMADRAIGELPTIFNSKNPLVKVFTMFQVEVNNDLSHLLKDIPKDARDKGLAALFTSVLKYMLGVYMFNDLFEWLFGRRVSIDPLSMLNDLAGDATGYELPNMFESAVLIAKGEWQGWEEFENGKGGDFFSDLVGDLKEWADDVPFISGLLGGGRFPIQAMLPEEGAVKAGYAALRDILKPEEDQENPDAYDWNKIYKTVKNPLYYWAMPAFGGQLRKIAEGIYAYTQHGSYSQTKQGKVLQYPILGYDDLVKSMIFGKTTTRYGKEWIESDFDSLTAPQTEAYINLVSGGSDPELIYQILHDLKGTERTAAEKAYALASAKLDDGERIMLFSALDRDKEAQNFADLMGAGLTFRQCADVLDEYRRLKDLEDQTAKGEEGTAERRRLSTEFSIFLADQGFDDKTVDAVQEIYDMQVKPIRYDWLTSAGIHREGAMELALDWSELEPLGNSSKVTDSQKIMAVADAGYLSESERHSAIRTLLEDDQVAKYNQYIVGYQIPVETYGNYIELSYNLKADDLDGDGKGDAYSLAKKKFAVINQLPLQPGQKTALAIYASGNAESTIRKYAPWL